MAFHGLAQTVTGKKKKQTRKKNSWQCGYFFQQKKQIKIWQHFCGKALVVRQTDKKHSFSGKLKQ